MLPTLSGLPSVRPERLIPLSQSGGSLAPLADPILCRYIYIKGEALTT